MHSGFLVETQTTHWAAFNNKGVSSGPRELDLWKTIHS